MKVCETCKAGVNHDVKVCPYCGASLKSWKRPAWWAISFLIIVILISPLFIHVYMDQLTSPKAQIEQIHDAIVAQDFEALQRAVDIPQMAEEEQDKLLAYLHDQSMKDFKKRAMKTTSRAKREAKNTHIYHEDGSALFDVVVTPYNRLYNKVDLQMREAVVQWVRQ